MKVQMGSNYSLSIWILSDILTNNQEVKMAFQTYVDSSWKLGKT
jgi:hypothetical protein